MRDYNQAKIYILKNKENDRVYIGSTTRRLCERMSDHRNDYKLVSSGRKLYKKTTAMLITQYPSAYMELLEEYPCSSQEELNRREAFHIRNHKGFCVNKADPIDGRYFSTKQKILQEAQKILAEVV